MAFFEADISALPRQVREGIRADCAAADFRRYQTAVAAQKEFARQRHQNPPRFRDGIGEEHMGIHPYFIKQCERAHGHNALDDADFAKWLKKQHPELRVQSVSGKMQVGYTGRRTRHGRASYTKVYDR